MITLKALVVDNSRVMRNMVMQSLRQTRMAEFEFIEAKDGVDALDLFDPTEIAIAFVDWNMPQMDGLEFVRQVRAMGTNRHIPIIMMTAERPTQQKESEYRASGANACIWKHYTVDAMQEELQRIIDQIESIMESQARRGSWLAKLFA